MSTWPPPIAGRWVVCENYLHRSNAGWRSCGDPRSRECNSRFFPLPSSREGTAAAVIKPRKKCVWLLTALPPFHRRGSSVFLRLGCGCLLTKRGKPWQSDRLNSLSTKHTGAAEGDDGQTPGENLSDLLGRVSKTSSVEIDNLIGDFEGLRRRLQTDRDRIQRELRNITH
jgi:hypothetical protein